MASDSDLEAYLNQLSKKTYSLKQDVDELGYGSSRPSSSEDKSADGTNSLDEEEQFNAKNRGRKIGHSTGTSDITALSEKYGRMGTSDITALSEKYGRPNNKKTLPSDEFSNLERKYLKKKSVGKSALKTEASQGASRREGANRPKSEISGHSTKSKDDIEPSSYESSVDEELARYLNETSLGEIREGESKRRIVTIKSVSPSTSCSTQDSSDNLINFNNILTVDDIIGKHSVDCDDAGNGGPNNEQSEDEVSEMMSIARMKSSAVSESDGQYHTSKEDISGSSKDVIKRLLRKTSVSLFYPDTEVETEDPSVEKLEGVLFMEVQNDIFHSSRRNSVMLPTTSRKSSTKSLPSVSIQDRASDDTSGDSSNESDAESVIENISAPVESSFAESVAERNSSENASANYTEKIIKKGKEKRIDDEKSYRKDVAKPKVKEKRIDDEKSYGKDVAKPKFNVQLVDPNAKSRDEAWAESSGSSGHLSSRSKPSPSSAFSRPRESEKLFVERNSDLGSPSNHGHSEGKETSPKSNKESKKSDRHSHKYSGKKSKKKHRHRSSSSSSSSSSTSSSSSSSSNSSRSYKKAYRKYSKKKRRHKRHNFNSWDVNPFAHPWWMHERQPMYPFGSENAFRLPRASHMEGWIPASSGIVGVDDIMRQQVALTKQFMDSQQALYHAYTATLMSSYRYTSLKDTEMYIKKKKIPLTFDEAYKIVQEESKNSRRKES